MEFRQYYPERIRKFVAYELSTMDFMTKILYLSLFNTNQAWELQEDFRRQANIELDSKSFEFSKIISGLTNIVKGLDEDPEESFLAEKEFREVIQNSLMKV